MASQSSTGSIYDFTVKVCFFKLSFLVIFVFYSCGYGFNLALFKLQDARGNDVELSKYKGKALLIVNVASQW